MIVECTKAIKIIDQIGCRNGNNKLGVKDIKMKIAIYFAAIGVLVPVLASNQSAHAEGNLENGKKVYRVCAACHSLEKGVHRTGPSLAKIWGQKAGSIDGFRRYSKALKNSNIVWTEKSLDQWLAHPKSFLPGNRMVFRGINNAAQRADLIAFLKGISEGEAKTAGAMQKGRPGQGPLNLKGLRPNNQVTGITHCADTFNVVTASGKTHQFWEMNLRLKIDSSTYGPPRGVPALIPGGMRGDRANLVFSSPGEISGFIKQKC